MLVEEQPLLTSIENNRHWSQVERMSLTSVEKNTIYIDHGNPN